MCLPSKVPRYGINSRVLCAVLQYVSYMLGFFLVMALFVTKRDRRLCAVGGRCCVYPCPILRSNALVDSEVVVPKLLYEYDTWTTIIYLRSARATIVRTKGVQMKQ